MKSKNTIKILGSGTSTGVPLVGCKCDICTSTFENNKRLRSSILITIDDKNILVDTSTDLRYQSLKYEIDKIENVLFTHHHADHVHGIDELRSFTFFQEKEITCYGNSKTLGRISTMFSYIFDKSHGNKNIPKLRLEEITGPVELLGEIFTPIEVLHGNDTILGYRFLDAAYITDCSGIPDKSLKKLKGLKLLILGALRYRPHNKHFNIEEALEVVKSLEPGRTVFTHLSHEIDHIKASGDLPAGVELAYDGMTIEL